MTQTVNKSMSKRNTVVSNRDTIVSEMQGIVRRAAEPGTPGENIKGAINRSARRLGLSYRRADTFWYGRRCAVLALEADRLRAAELSLLVERRARLTAELSQVTARINVLEGPGNNAMDSAEDGAGLGMAR